MNTIQPFNPHQYTRQTENTSIRKAAETASEMPKLTADEQDLIKKQFKVDNRLSYYSGNGQVNEQLFARGMNLDTKV